MHLFIEKGTRGGISDIVKQIINTKSHDSREESKYITYLDPNNLYGWAVFTSISLIVDLNG